MSSDRGTPRRRQTWECAPCRRTIVVHYHTGEKMPDERECRCGRPMGLVLFADGNTSRAAVSIVRAQA